MKIKPTKSKRRTPPEVYKEVCERSGGTWVQGLGLRGSRNVCEGGHCEEPKCPNPNGDFRELQFSHTKHRKMGGTTSPEIHSAKNIRRLCGVCHDLKDGR